MASEEIVSQLIKSVAQIFNVSPDELSVNTQFVDDLHAKSQNMWGLAAVAERMCGVKVSYSDINQCATIGEAAEFLEKQKG